MEIGFFIEEVHQALGTNSTEMGRKIYKRKSLNIDFTLKKSDMNSPLVA